MDDCTNYLPPVQSVQCTRSLIFDCLCELLSKDEAFFRLWPHSSGRLQQGEGSALVLRTLLGRNKTSCF